MCREQVTFKRPWSDLEMTFFRLTVWLDFFRCIYMYIHIYMYIYIYIYRRLIWRLWLDACQAKQSIICKKASSHVWSSQKSYFTYTGDMTNIDTSCHVWRRHVWRSHVTYEAVKSYVTSHIQETCQILSQVIFKKSLSGENKSFEGVKSCAKGVYIYIYIYIYTHCVCTHSLEGVESQLTMVWLYEGVKSYVIYKGVMSNIDTSCHIWTSLVWRRHVRSSHMSHMWHWSHIKYWVWLWSHIKYWVWLWIHIKYWVYSRIV